MNNETLKRDLASRLPYGVKIYDGHKPYTLTGLRHFNNNKLYAVCDIDDDNYTWSYLKGCIPYLFNTSALTKPIRLANYNNGEPFVPKYELEKILGIYQCNYLMDNLDLIISKKKIPQGKVHFDFIDFVNAIDFLNKIHINYRLSPDQFIEVTDENNPYI